MKKIKLLFVFCLFFPLYGQEDMFPKLVQNFENRIKKITLKNNIKILMLKRGISPTVSIYVKFKVGGADETADISGTAHLLEHMLFKGTKQVGTQSYEKEKKYLSQIRSFGKKFDVLRLKKKRLEDEKKLIPKSLNEEIAKISQRLKIIQTFHKKIITADSIDKIYSENGGVGFNAYTTNDVTNYQISLPVNKIELWAKIESDRLQNPILREYYKERDVVLEERRARIDDRGVGKLLEKYLETAFGNKHPYGIPVIGYGSTLPFLDIDQTYEFFQKYYIPKNMVIAIVGNFDYNKVESILIENFEHIPNPKTIEKKNEIKSIFNQGTKRVKVTHKSGPIKIMGWHKPKKIENQKEYVVFDMISSILTDGYSSRLYKRLVTEEKLALNVYGSQKFPGERYNNLFLIYIINQSNASPEKIEQIVLEEIEKLKTEPIDEREFEKIKNQQMLKYFSALKLNSYLADILSYYELLFGDWKELIYDYQRLDSVQKEDIPRVISKYITQTNIIIGDLESEK